MNAGHVTERARSFAEKLRPQEPKDDRSTDEEMADFIKKYAPSYRESMKSARQKKDSK